MQNSNDNDKKFMRRALTLAKKVKGTTCPNPAVGAVIVKDNNIIATGATSHYGGDHAEVCAIKNAGDNARGATLYVTLEPCNHTGKTPPCTNAIINAGIKKVVAAVEDPNPLVKGRGLQKLRENNIEVLTGILSDEATLINEDFFYAITHKRPWVSLKLAMTLDGKIADYNNESKWITSADARREVQNIRKIHSAIVVGKNTLLHDDPKLTARCGSKTYYPARIVFCSNANDIPQDLYLVKNAHEARTIFVCKYADYTRDNRDEEWRLNTPNFDPIEVWRTYKATDQKSHIDGFLNMAYNEGLNSILIEGGSAVASAFLEHGFVNKVYLFYGNKIFGAGLNGLSFNNGLPVNNCVTLNNVTHKSLGDNFLITGYPTKL